MKAKSVACRFCLKTSGITLRKVDEDIYVCEKCLAQKGMEFKREGKLK